VCRGLRVREPIHTDGSPAKGVRGTYIYRHVLCLRYERESGRQKSKNIYTWRGSKNNVEEDKAGGGGEEEEKVRGGARVFK